MKIEPLELTSLSADNSIFQSHWWATVKRDQLDLTLSVTLKIKVREPFSLS